MNRYVLVCWLALATIFPQVMFATPARSESTTSNGLSAEIQKNAEDATTQDKEKSIVADPDNQNADKKDVKDEAIVAQSKSKPAAKPKPVTTTPANKPTPKPSVAPLTKTTSPTIVAQNTSKPLFQPKITITDQRGNTRVGQQTAPVTSPVPQISVTTPSSPPNLRLPGRVQGQLPPFQRRPVPAPVGDISVSNTFLRPDIVDLSSAARVPRLSLKEAPVREVLSIIARTAGLNVAFADDASQQAGQPPATPGQPGQTTGVNSRITLDIENETAQEVFNSVLRLSGLDANRIGRTVFVAAKLPFNLRNTITRAYRMNQITVGEASAFLASLGAERSINRKRPIPGVQTAQLGTASQAIVTVDTETVPVLESIQGNPNSVLPLKGLQVVAEERTNSITMVGSPSLVEYAAAQLAKIDARKRQVAVNVRIVDVNLLASQRVGSNSSFGINDTFFNINQGVATLNFGELTPPASAGNLGANPYGRPVVNNPNAGTSLFVNPNGTQQTRDPVTGLPVNLSPNQPGSPFSPDGNPLTPGISGITQNQIYPAAGQQPYSSPTTLVNPANGTTVLNTSGNSGVVGRPATYYTNPGGVINANLVGLNPTFKTGPYANTNILLDPTTGTPVVATAAVPATAPATNTLLDSVGQAAQFAFSLPQIFQYPKQFLTQLEATIQNGHAKVLTDPTLTVQEGEQASVSLTEDVNGGLIREFQVVNGQTITAEKIDIKKAGVTLNVKIDRVDENGFVNMSVSPKVSAIANVQTVQQLGQQNQVAFLSERSLNSGSIRMRDGQTLILSGVIRDSDRETVSKVPFFGDLPIIGALFRSTTTSNTRNEVIIIVTPRIINDSETANWGYIYQPGPEAQKVLDSNRTPFQNQ
jgi:type IV pilus assembly protein PilQ